MSFFVQLVHWQLYIQANLPNISSPSFCMCQMRLLSFLPHGVTVGIKWKDPQKHKSQDREQSTYLPLLLFLMRHRATDACLCSILLSCFYSNSCWKKIGYKKDNYDLLFSYFQKKTAHYWFMMAYTELRH